jgi:GT2 family glycosyltransferase
VADLITICIPTYRRPSLLLYCLHTCFAQDYRPLEIDIGDNSPGVDTQELMRSVTPPPGVTVRYRRHDPPLGPIGNVAYLFAQARGRRLILLHDDDALLPGAVTALDRAFGMAPDVVAAYGMLEVVNAAGEYLHADTERDNAAARRTPDQAGLRRDMLVCALSRQFPPNGFLIDTEAARRIGYRDREEVGLAADTDFGIRLAHWSTPWGGGGGPRSRSSCPATTRGMRAWHGRSMRSA